MGFFGFSKKQKSAVIARDRLQLVLFQDRMNTSPEMLDLLKTDIIRVIASYVDIDEEELDIRVGTGNEVGEDGPALMANIPIKGWKRR